MVFDNIDVFKFYVLISSKNIKKITLLIILKKGIISILKTMLQIKFLVNSGKIKSRLYNR